MPLLADVIVDLKIPRLDRPLTYLVPEKLEPLVFPGRVVRVPLRGRRVRAWVVDLRPAEGGGKVEQPPLSEIAAVSGRAAVFDESLLRTARLCARRYLQPLASFLALSTPLRMGRMGGMDDPHAGSTERTSHGRSSGKKTYMRLGVADDAVGAYAEAIGRTLGEGKGAIVVVPEVREGSRILDALVGEFPSDAAVVHSGVDPAERSRALWSAAIGEKRLVLGGRAAVFASMNRVSPGILIVHGEHDKSFKEQRAPYYDARVVAEYRAGTCGADLLFASPTPSLSWAGGGVQREEWEVREPERTSERARWPIVEVVEPARRRLPERIVGAVIEAIRSSARAVVLLPRARLGAAGPGVEEVAGFLERVVPSATVARVSSSLGAVDLRAAFGAQIVVATIAVLADVERPPVGVAVALGVDAILARPYGRAVEDAMGELWELASWVARSVPPRQARRGRVVVETKASDHHAVQALVRGDYRFFTERELAVRLEAQAPPFVHLIRLRGSIDSELTAELRSLPGTELLGPAPYPRESSRRGQEALLKVSDVDAIVDQLRDTLWARGEGILVEVDPRDW